MDIPQQVVTDHLQVHNPLQPTFYTSSPFLLFIPPVCIEDLLLGQDIL